MRWVMLYPTKAADPIMTSKATVPGKHRGWRRAGGAPTPPDCRDVSRDAQRPLTQSEIAAIAKALGNPARLRIIEQFSEPRPLTVQDIVDACERAPSTVSEHLRILREAGLLMATKDGPRTWYCMRRSVLYSFVASIESMTSLTTQPKQPVVGS